MVRGLGKGLDALIADTMDPDEGTKIEEITLKNCRPNPYQPRKRFDVEAIDELKQSILEYGVIQPIIVRKSIKGYEIVVGERRFRAAMAANLTTIPAIVQELSDEKMMELGLLENLQREDLTPIEEAYAYTNLMQTLNITQEALSKKLGKSRSHIANTTRLLTLPLDVISLISDGNMSMGHGRSLLALKDKEHIPLLVDKIQTEKLNVRQVEKLINEWNSYKVKQHSQKKKDIYLIEKESILRERLGTGVKIQRGKRKGKIEIEFYTDTDLERLLELLEN